MMEWSTLRNELNVALNEATLLGVEVNVARRIAGATFSVLALPALGEPPADSRIQLVFRNVGRVVALLRNDGSEAASAIPFEVGDLLSVVQSFGGQSIYGWEFFDVDVAAGAAWQARPSLDWRSGEGGLSRTITLFQNEANGNGRSLDLCVWFDDLEARRPDGTVVPLETVAADGRRWWDALFAGDPRTRNAGIMPAGLGGPGA